MSAPGSADGMKTDRDGRLFATSPFGVIVYNPDGTPVDTIFVPGQTSNCNWGDEDGNTLYITSGAGLYRVRNTWTSIKTEPRGNNIPTSFRLENSYPNPFNDSTRITFTTTNPGRIGIDIFNTLGEKVAMLTDRHYTAGEHQLDWNADDQASGVYIIQLETPDGIDLKKCTYIK